MRQPLGAEVRKHKAVRQVVLVDVDAFFDRVGQHQGQADRRGWNQAGQRCRHEEGESGDPACLPDKAKDLGQGGCHRAPPCLVLLGLVERGTHGLREQRTNRMELLVIPPSLHGETGQSLVLRRGHRALLRRRRHRLRNRRRAPWSAPGCGSRSELVAQPHELFLGRLGGHGTGLRRLIFPDF